ncbi:MAG TPA: hypothetical protein PLZ61_02250 [Candidatus Cryosericum sp.]|nr:hypothetical protein [Candidatus Cryosericum sp.]
MALELVTDINLIGDVDESGVASVAISAPCMVRSQSGAVTPALAAVAGQVVPCTGFAPFAAGAGEAVTVVREGKVRGASGLTPGTPVYLGETAGAVQDAAPTGTGKVVQIVGIAISATEFMLDIAPTYTTL